MRICITVSLLYQKKYAWYQRIPAIKNGVGARPFLTRREIACCASDYAEEFFYHHIQKHLHDHQIANRKENCRFQHVWLSTMPIGTNNTKLMNATACLRKNKNGGVVMLWMWKFLVSNQCVRCYQNTCTVRLLQWPLHLSTTDNTAEIRNDHKRSFLFILHI